MGEGADRADATDEANSAADADASADGAAAEVPDRYGHVSMCAINSLRCSPNGPDHGQPLQTQPRLMATPQTLTSTSIDAYLW
jgi:hypothetical protein